MLDLQHSCYKQPTIQHYCYQHGIVLEYKTFSSVITRKCMYSISSYIQGNVSVKGYICKLPQSTNHKLSVPCRKQSYEV